MHHASLDDILATGKRSPFSDDSAVIDGASELAARTRQLVAAQAPARRRRRLLVALPAGLLAAGLLTAGAVVASTLVPTVVTVPVSYVTDTGKAFDCRITIFGGGGDDATTRRIADYINGKDWTGIGQRIYDRALKHPWTPNPKDTYTTADGVTHSGDAPTTPAERDNLSWMDAATALIPGPLPSSVASDDLLSTGWSSGSCTGQLH